MASDMTVNVMNNEKKVIMALVEIVCFMTAFPLWLSSEANVFIVFISDHAESPVLSR